MDSLTYEIKAVPRLTNTFCLELKGFLYAGTLTKLADAFQSAPSSMVRLMLDLTEVQYVSTGAWSQILEFQHRLKNAGGKMVLFGLKPEVQDGFEFMELSQNLETFPDRKEAITGEFTSKV